MDCGRSPPAMRAAIMSRMSPHRQDRPTRRRRPHLPVIMIVLTAAACLAALAFRTPLRSRYWAWRIVGSADPAERAIYLTALCNAGDGGRWGTSTLLGHDSAEIRQLGAVVLQHVRTEWSRGRLLRGLEDPDEDVRELAALGLAIHGDNSILPTLKRMYLTLDPATADAACLALDRLATPEAISVLAELVHEPADAACRAPLVDALARIGQPACVPPLIQLLADHRVCGLPPRSLRVTLRILADLTAAGQLATQPALPETQPAAQTIAERAAAGLARITGLSPPFSSSLPHADQQRAAEQWSGWYAQQAAAP